MKRRVLSLCIGVLPLCVFGLSGCTTIREPFTSAIVSTPAPTPTPTPTPSSKLVFAYVENDFGNSISMFTVSAAGLWTPNTPATIPVGNHPESLVVDPAGKFVYVANSADSTVSMFTISAATGLLTPTSPATVPTGTFPQYVSADPLGRFVYTANTSDNTISGFSINKITGVLLPTVPAAFATGTHPSSVTVDPTGRFLYAMGQLGSLTTFTINATSGALTPIDLISGLSYSFEAKVDPSGRYLFVTENDLAQVDIFLIDQTTGRLTPAGTPSVAVGAGPTGVAIDATSSYVYVVNRKDGTISQFNLNLANGSLTPMSTPLVASPGLPFQILIDPSNQLAYVSEENTNSVSILSLGTNGALSPYSTAPTGNTPGGIGIAGRQ